MKCKICGFEEDEQNKFVGIFLPRQSFLTTDRKRCGVYGCPNCNNVIYITDVNYIADRKKEYKNTYKLKDSKPSLKYDKEKYVGNKIYEYENKSTLNYKEKLVKCRKIHICSLCGEEIQIGEYALNESGFIEESSFSTYTCTKCVEDWLEQNCQVKIGDSDEN